MPKYIVTTANGERLWDADDSQHAREQHEDDSAFRDDPNERILDITLDAAPVAGADFSEVSYAKLTAEQDTILQWLKDQGASHNEACASLSDLLERFPAPAPTSAVLDDETREFLFVEVNRWESTIRATTAQERVFDKAAKFVRAALASRVEPAPTSAVLDDETRELVEVNGRTYDVDKLQRIVEGRPQEWLAFKDIRFSAVLPDLNKGAIIVGPDNQTYDGNKRLTRLLLARFNGALVKRVTDVELEDAALASRVTTSVKS